MRFRLIFIFGSTRSVIYRRVVRNPLCPTDVWPGLSFYARTKLLGCRGAQPGFISDRMQRATVQVGHGVVYQNHNRRQGLA